MGQFNADTAGFYSWLVGYLEGYFANQPDEELRADRGARGEHVYAQVLVVLQEPDCELEQRIRQMEDGNDLHFNAQGPEIQWWFLLRPYAEAATSPSRQERLAMAFRNVVRDYEDAVVFGGAESGNFVPYLLRSDFDDVWPTR